MSRVAVFFPSGNYSISGALMPGVLNFSTANQHTTGLWALDEGGSVLTLHPALFYTRNLC